MGNGSEIRSQMTEVRKTAEVPTPSQIFADIEAQPPLMRPQTARAYRGMAVDWSLTFANAKADRAGEVSVYFHSESHRLSMVTGKVSLRRYPQLKQLRIGTLVHVRGKIREADTLFIELELTDLLLGDK